LPIIEPRSDVGVFLAGNSCGRLSWPKPESPLFVFLFLQSSYEGGIEHRVARIIEQPDVAVSRLRKSRRQAVTTLEEALQEKL
jgi:hypothetical protein